MSNNESKTGFRLHWLSWLTLVLLSLIMTVIVLPGIVVPADESGLPIADLALNRSQYVALSHGWPNEYMRSKRSESLGNSIAWASPRAWPMGNTVFSFELKSLLIDFLVAGVIITIGTLAVEFWRRRRKGVWFSLLDMLVAVALFAMVTVWYHGHASDYEAEFQALNTWEGGHMYFICEQHLQTADWLTRLVGGESQIRFCKHVTELELARHPVSWPYGSPAPTDLFPFDRDKVNALAGFKRVEVINFDGPVLPEVPSLVASLNRLHTFRIEHENAYVRGAPGFATAPITGTPSVFYNDGLRTTLEKKVSSFDTIQKLDQLEQLTNLELDLGYISKSGWRKLPALSKLTNLSLASYEIFVEDLNGLDRFKNLKQVRLSISATNQELEQFQCAHPRLKVSWDRSADLDARQIVHRRIETWGLIEGWYRQKCREFYCEGDEKGDSTELDLTRLKLTKERVGLITKADVDLASIKSILVGRVDSAQTLNQLVKRCSGLKSLELYAEFSSEAIDQLVLPKRLYLTIRQGDLTVKDLNVLIEKHQPEWLNIYDATVTDDDVAALEEAWPDTLVDSHRFELDLE